MGKSYKHGVNILKEVGVGKLKAVRLKYREAVEDASKWPWPGGVVFSLSCVPRLGVAHQQLRNVLEDCRRAILVKRVNVNSPSHRLHLLRILPALQSMEICVRKNQ